MVEAVLNYILRLSYSLYAATVVNAFVNDLKEHEPELYKEAEEMIERANNAAFNVCCKTFFIDMEDVEKLATALSDLANWLNNVELHNIPEERKKIYKDSIPKLSEVLKELI